MLLLHCENFIGYFCIINYCQDFQFLVSNPREQVLQIEVNDCLGFADMAIGIGEVNHLSSYLGFNLHKNSLIC